MKDKINILTSNDPVLGKFIEIIGELELNKRDDYFQSLVSSIIGQQLSAKAAATIFGRFVEFTKGVLTPEKILSISAEELRSLGISYSKIKYLKDLSQKVLDKELALDTLDRLTNDEVIASLTSVKGIGKWTAEMFLIFSLGRENVLSLLDVGLQRGAKWLYNKEDGKKILEERAANWEPYHSIASLYLWEAVNQDLVITYKSFDDYLQSLN
ncbi:DNA-3-methyladenine glycosylase [Neobacillus pocheonensis]|uniref:DNA-3-methyladenine glycosylase II n=1 Tax=Neobacillus pocheonensis TaxID=363869 RepID=A0ABT0WFR2_9BACI|nr:DNA-3-methyladenine glycosylase [Neobacillus pocheonensis]